MQRLQVLDPGLLLPVQRFLLGVQALELAFEVLGFGERGVEGGERFGGGLVFAAGEGAGHVLVRHLDLALC